MRFRPVPVAASLQLEMVSSTFCCWVIYSENGKTQLRIRCKASFLLQKQTIQKASCGQKRDPDQKIQMMVVIGFGPRFPEECQASESKGSS